MKPTIGRIVMVKCKDKIYPAIVTHVWSDVCVNLSVFNDISYPFDELEDLIVLRTSIMKGDNNYEWEWPRIEHPAHPIVEPPEATPLPA